MYQKTVLDNGVRILTEELPHVRSAAIGIWVNVGARHEEKNINGIAHFIEHMLLRGQRDGLLWTLQRRWIQSEGY